MKYYFILIIIFILGCKSSKINYIADDTGKYYLSYFTYFDNQYTVFSYGKMESIYLPISYIKVKEKAFDDWKCLITWKNDTAILYEPYHQFESVNIQAEKRLKVYKMPDTLFYRIYYDNSNNFYKKIGN